MIDVAIEINAKVQDEETAEKIVKQIREVFAVNNAKAPRIELIVK
jgi:hypothetical protein